MARRTRTTPTMKTITVGGVSRSYGIVVPTSKAPPGGFPAILTFHGGGTATMAQVQAMASWPKHVAAPVVEVYPLATEKGWAWEPGQDWADDVAFVAALKAEITAKFGVDYSRFFGAGISQGGGMVLKLALDAPGVLMAHGVVVAAPVQGMTGIPCPLERQIALIHGTADPYVPFGWAERQTDWLASLNGATMGDYMPISTTARARVSDDGFVEHYVIDGGGHEWPGSTGPSDVVASERLARFFGV